VPLWVLAAKAVRRAFRKGKLVTDGYYAVCRNPVYALSLVWICGIILLFRSWLLLAVPLIVYVAAKLLIRKEERFLEEEFGEAFVAYKRRVNPFFPPPGRYPFKK
jgi:protein-S-isoprenylcysteine O-methyltransferase Ste14